MTNKQADKMIEILERVDARLLIMNLHLEKLTRVKPQQYSDVMPTVSSKDMYFLQNRGKR